MTGWVIAEWYELAPESLSELKENASGSVSTARAGHPVCASSFLRILIIAELRELLATMSLSTYSQDWFDLARKELNISRGLESVGETRFATIYWSLDSTLRGIPAFVLQRHFSDDEDVFNFKRDLTRLGAVLMPFARAIQCLESKDTTPADLYLYWLAVVAQLNDLITKDDNAGPKSKYETTVKKLIRSIANFRFTQLIEDEQSSNVYFTAFVLDPDNRGASILATPNPLAVRPVAISFLGGEPTVKPQRPLIERIGLSLMKILQREYGKEYRPDRTVEQARTAMEEINPYIALRAPADALRALKTQLKAFLNGDAPFDRKKKPNESARDWWVDLLNRDDSDILAALAVKIFSSNPVSMPDERGMSTITWINSKNRNRQDVSTERPSKPVTVNWRDIRATIHGTPNADKTSVDAENAVLETATLEPVDPAHDGLGWLDDGLPDLRSTSNRQFDLAAEFDIKQYLHILANSVEGVSEVSDAGKSDRMEDGRRSLKAAADSVAPKEDEWNSWEI
ncbi:hypothetical protein B0H14DRAFT_3605957 [Mycena olivaceomarginata]|nr:hypothetical protein B0H14DRAFT_3605957 [Mycena olivaceomarginata]